MSEHLKPFVIFTGPPGSGKTTLADAVAEAMGGKTTPVTVIDKDRVRKQLYPNTPHLPPEALGMSEEDAERLASYKTYLEMYKRAGSSLDQGFPAFLAGTFRSPETHKRIRSIARDSNAGLVVVALTAPKDVLEARVLLRGDDHISNVRSTEALKRTLSGFVPYPNPDLVIDTSDYPPGYTAVLIASLLNLRGF